ncbi:hypothetical protein F751_0459 [Auxenochlorella protothecoides]|uniref:Uncharacterized protein n=1 Tax=Auxenochlorella protothecoides TaxID=3075 RepID=A0A087SAA9_AUXPR|nr:hypothetical protein F751_0459 [Auxenochlorella protothecoides]KFM22663.1 hypothetical protein F751_0459 [Auxenochlorella protothecoides]
MMPVPRGRSANQSMTFLALAADLHGSDPKGKCVETHYVGWRRIAWAHTPSLSSRRAAWEPLRSSATRRCL